MMAFGSSQQTNQPGGFRPIDPKQLPSELRPRAEDIARAANAVRGWADLHAHPATHLGFGGVFHGSPGMDLRGSDVTRDLPECSPDKHSGFDGDPVRDEVHKRLLRQLDALTGFRHGRHGPPDYRDWPHALSVLHQQMHVTMIHRAYLAGLRVMIASVTDNQVIGLLRSIGFNLFGNDVPPANPQHEYDSAVRQLEFLQRFVAANASWMEIVHTPAQARQAIRDNKLAVILGVEMDSLSPDRILRLVDSYGVRSVIPIHLANNRHFGGCAVYNDVFNTLNWFLNRRFFEVDTDPNLDFRLSTPQYIAKGSMGALEPRPFERRVYTDGFGGHKNRLGISSPDAIKRLMQRGVLLDVAHMSEKAIAEVLNLARQFGYPLINTHSGLRRGRAHSERAMLYDHARVMAELGGVFGLGSEVDAKVTLAHVDPGQRVWRPGTRQLNQWVHNLAPAAGFSDRFVLTIDTGGDNLDGGYGFGVFLRLRDGGELFWDNVNRNEEIPGHSRRSFVLFTRDATRVSREALRNGVNLADVRQLELRSEWYPGDPFRNIEWDVNAIRLDAFLVDNDPVAQWMRWYLEAMSIFGEGGVAFGTDMNGFAPQIAFSRRRVSYPLSYLSAMGIRGEHAAALNNPFRMGSKTFDLSRDGLAHYGMFADLLEDLWGRGSEGQQVVRSLFFSAERVIQTWERAEQAKERVR
ncbi:MAG: hypothetical protein RMM08_00225 [Armatimonadota bacterium]|nr:membrane dipeptidase [bacterium]MDW8319760.1 hypothetical protein [Armatimonadota bacterium]